MASAIGPTLSASRLTELQFAAAEHIERRGIRAFMDEDYNLTGTRVRAVVTAENVELARAFGLPVPGDDDELPVAIDKKLIRIAFDGARRDESRAELAQFFADPAHVPSLSLGQRMFLEWHYRSPNNYQFTLEKPWRGISGAARILGWNRETELAGRGDFLFFTGLLGCTGVCAVAGDGSAYMSHWDEVCNPKQFEGYARFAARHPGGRVSVVGVTSRDLAAGLRELHKDVDIYYHVKRIYFERTYTVCFSRTSGETEVRVHEADVTDDYVPSTHNGEYGRWFPYGRFGQAFPGADDEFHPCEFERLG